MLAVLGCGVADVGERARPGDDGEHGDGKPVGDREQAAARAHEPSGRPTRPGRPGGPSPPASGLAPLLLCPSGAAPVNAEFFTPGYLPNARPALTHADGHHAAGNERARPGRAGAVLPLIYRNPVFEAPFFLLARN